MPTNRKIRRVRHRRSEYSDFDRYCALNDRLQGEVDYDLRCRLIGDFLGEIVSYKDDPDVRDDYRRGTWDYARGRMAKEHPRYDEAVEIAKSGPNPFDPFWIRTWVDVVAVLEGCWFDVFEAYFKLRFFGFLKHTKGKKWMGKQFIPIDWQKYDVILPLFGWKRADGTRRFRRGSIWISKKNGKTTLLAAIAILLMRFDGEGGAEVYSAAVDRDQAGRIYGDFSAMVRGSNELSGIFRCLDSKKLIKCRDIRDSSFFKTLSADAKKAEGMDISGLIFDEIHALKKDDLWRATFHGDIAREQPLSISLSTAGEYDPESVGCREWDVAGKVMNGALEDWEYFVYRAAADPERSRPGDVRAWKKANPSWGVAVKESELKTKYNRAKMYPQELMDFKRYRMNIWVRGVKKFLDFDAWLRECNGKIDPDFLKGRSCFYGLDLADKIDLAAGALVFPFEGDDLAELCEMLKHPIPQIDCAYASLMRFWMPEENVNKRAQQDKVPFQSWIEKGLITATDGNVIDYKFIEKSILADWETYDIQGIGIDPRGASNLSTRLIAALGEEYVWDVQQGILSLSEPTKELQRAVKAGAFFHGDNYVLRWMADNMVVKTDENANVKPDKMKSISRIDGISGIVNAIFLRQRDEGDGVYEFAGFG